MINASSWLLVAIIDSAERKLLNASERLDQAGWLEGFITRPMQAFNKDREFSGRRCPGGRDCASLGALLRAAAECAPTLISSMNIWRPAVGVGVIDPSGDKGRGELGPLFLFLGEPGLRFRSLDARKWVTFRSSCRTEISLALT